MLQKVTCIHYNIFLHNYYNIIVYYTDQYFTRDIQTATNCGAVVFGDFNQYGIWNLTAESLKQVVTKPSRNNAILNG